MTAHDFHTDIAESILEHAESISRLDAQGMDAMAYAAAYASHVGAIRLLAVPHMDPQPDRELMRKLKQLSGHVPGVQVRLADGAIQLTVDAVRAQHRFNLWNRNQMLANEEDEDFDAG